MVPVYQLYQKDQDQISGATYISDVVFFSKLKALVGLRWEVELMVMEEEEVTTEVGEVITMAEAIIIIMEEVIMEDIIIMEEVITMVEDIAITEDTTDLPTLCTS